MDHSGLDGATLLITGGAGFIGTSVTARIVDTCRVVVLDTFERDSLVRSGLASHPNLTVIKGDVRDLDSVSEAAREADYVLHMAAIAGVGTVVSHPARTLQINLTGTHNVLDVLQRRGGVRRFIDFSTSEVYGPQVFRATETGMTTQGSVYEPRWFYAVSKLASEFLTRGYHIEFGLPAACIRPFNVYGPGQLGEGAVRNFVLRALADEPLVVHGEGEQIRSWCFIDDMVDAALACLTVDAAVGRHFNIGNPRATTSTLELARAVVRLSGSQSEILMQEIAYPDVEVRVPSIKEAEQHLGFDPKIDMEEGLLRTIAWYREQGLRGECAS